jgi:hypothetical protein
VIVVAVRWYLRFGLSYRDVEELLAERGVEVDHVTIYRWVQRFPPLLAEATRSCGTSCSPRRGIVPTSTPTTVSRRTTAGCRRGSGRCVGSSMTVAPGS